GGAGCNARRARARGPRGRDARRAPAADGGRDLREEARPGRRPDRLEPVRGRARARCAGAQPGAGRVVRARRRADQGAGGDRGRAGRSSASGNRARCRPDHRLRLRRLAPDAAAARRSRGRRWGSLSPRLCAAAGHAALMPRYKLTLEYDGTGLVGWQRQATGLSVQEILEIAVERFCGETVRVHGAGRTDAGVHALAQVAHLDLRRETDPDEIRGALNHHVRPHAVSVLAVEAVPATFHARTSARGRHYRYRILNRRAPPALERGRVWHVGPPLDVAAMQEGARHLLGKHDFTTFRDALCQAKSPIKTLDALAIARVG